MAEFQTTAFVGAPQSVATARIERAEPARASLAVRIFETLVSVKFAVGVIIVIAVVCVVGTILPQGAEVRGYVQEHPAAATHMTWLAALGLTNVFESWWFIGLLSLLAATVAACSTRRLAVVRRTSGFARRRAFGSMLAHISMLLILAGSLVRAIWGVKGEVPIREGETATQFHTGMGFRELPFGLQLGKFEVERYGQLPGSSSAVPSSPVEDVNAQVGLSQIIVQIPAKRLSARVPVQIGRERSLTLPGETVESPSTVRVKVLRYLPDFLVVPGTLEVTNVSASPKNPALLVAVSGPGYQSQRWLLAKSPGANVQTADTTGGGDTGPLRLLFEFQAPPAPKPSGPIKSFKSSVRVMQDGAIVRTSTIEVNRPFHHRGYSFYQLGYNPDDPTWTSLMVVRDPGVPAVYLGFLLLVAGLFIVFYLNPWLEQRSRQS